MKATLPALPNESSWSNPSLRIAITGIRQEAFEAGVNLGIQALEKILSFLQPVGKEPPEGWKAYYQTTVVGWVQAELDQIK